MVAFNVILHVLNFTLKSNLVIRARYVLFFIIILEECDMVYVEASNYLHVCKGNYSWTTTRITPGAPNNYLFLVPLGVNFLFPCAA
jgi:hypothetical protein